MRNLSDSALDYGQRAVAKIGADNLLEEGSTRATKKRFWHIQK